MSRYTLQNSAASYARLWNGMLINRDRRVAVEAVVDRIRALRPRYESVSAATRVPWFIIAIVHKMEANCDFTKHLHNGDSLQKRTWQVPAGRPKTGSPPFTWEESAIDAIQHDGLDKIKDWTIEQVAFCLEKFNGFGYRKLGIPSPYLWSFTNRYTQGKFVRDGAWDAHAISQQSGGMAILKMLMEKDRSVVVSGGSEPTPVAVDENEKLPPANDKLRGSKTLYGAVLAFFGGIYAYISPWLSWLVDFGEDVSGLIREALVHATEWQAPVDAALSLMGTSLPWLGFAAMALGTLIVLNARISAWWNGKVG